jgi:hypothetical protein
MYIYIPQRQGDYPLYSPITTRMGYGRTILIPRSPHEVDRNLGAEYHAEALERKPFREYQL